MTLAQIVDELREYGFVHLTGPDAEWDRSDLARMQRFANARGVRFRSRLGCTVHGTKVRTLTLVEGA